MDLWLIWLEPWNVIQRKQNGSPSTVAKDFVNNVVSDYVHAKSSQSSSSDRAQRQQQNAFWKPPHLATSASKYTPQWESYVAANLHFYTVPLAIFLRRARELDFENRFQPSIKYVQRVLRVYSPDLLRSLDKLLQRQAADDTREGGAGPGAAGRQSTMMSVVEQHERVLNEYCPPRIYPVDGGFNFVDSCWSLEMLQDDMHSLLEEFCLRHRKMKRQMDFLDKVLGLKAANEAIIGNLVKRAIEVVKFPKDDGEKYVGTGAWPEKQTNDGASSSSEPPERGQYNILTERGREQILSGERMCDATDVKMLGDPMYSRVKSYEVAILVSWSIFLSDRLNSWFGLLALDTCLDSDNLQDLDSDDERMTMKLVKQGEESKNLWFRFNLRFLADCRNFFWILILIASYVTRKLYGMLLT
mmetsp:Transcript_1695/g.1851  ORF Transcript_1695/g.1851 Transcript_1695/m.1851 type:complete len:414 (-) Transcript_1695:171-1412(-)